eukprot:jgi/Mesvir1/15581/Mv03200-RA.1
MEGHALKLAISFLKCNSNQEAASTKKMAKTCLAQGCDMESSLTITNKSVHPKMGASGSPYMLANAASAASCAGTLPHAVAPLYTPRASDKLGYKSSLPLKKRPLPPMPMPSGLVGANQQSGSRDAVEIIIDIGKAADQQAHSEPKALADGGATSKCGSSEAPQESKYVRPAPVHWRPYLSALQADPADVPANKKRPGLTFVLQHIGGAKPAASVTRLAESCNSTDDEEVAAAHTLVSINQGRRTIAPKEGVELHVDKRQRLDSNNKASMFETAVLELMEARQMKKVASYMVDLATMHGKPYL